MSRLSIALLGVGLLYYCWPSMAASGPGDIRLLHDDFDVGVYFESSRWAVGEGLLYQDVFSEYPLPANLLFGLCRAASKWACLFDSERQTFGFLWACLGWLAFVWSSHLVLTRIKPGRLGLVAWFAPSVVYFSLYRFDIYPTLATVLALLAIRREHMKAGALWLGLAVALKGYALFTLPSFAIYVWRRRGKAEAMSCSLLCLAPFILCNLAVLSYAGIEGVLSPFLYHAQRGLNMESTYDGLSLEWLVHRAPRLPFLLQTLCALAPATRRPETFQELVHCMLFSVVGFISFTVFYSPQFCLWVVAFVLFSEDRKSIALTACLTWITYIYFPLAFDTRTTLVIGPVLFNAVITLLSLLRLWIMFEAWRQVTGDRAAYSLSRKASSSP